MDIYNFLDYLNKNKIKYILYEKYENLIQINNLIDYKNKYIFLNINNNTNLINITKKFNLYYDPVFNNIKIYKQQIFNIAQYTEALENKYEFNEISIKIKNEILNKNEWITLKQLFLNESKYIMNPANLIDILYEKAQINKKYYKHKYFKLYYSNNKQLNIIRTHGCYLLDINKDINDYFKITEELGRGGFSKIYKVELKSILKKYYYNMNPLINTNKTFILKQLSKKNKEDKEYTLSNKDIFDNNEIKTLLYESQMLDILNDSYIINSYGCFIQWINKKNKYNIYILLEYGGQNLRKILDSKNEKDIQSVIQNLPKLLETLKNLHKNNIFHRDIKLENMVYLNNKVKFIDFGFSCDFENCVFRKRGTKYYLLPDSSKLYFNPNKKHLFKDSLKLLDCYAFALTCYIIITQNIKVFYNIKNERIINTMKFKSYVEANTQNREYSKLFKFIIKYLSINPIFNFN